MAKNTNVWIALGIAVALLGAVIAVNYFYGWDNVYEDVKSMGKSVWFAFESWVGVQKGNETIVMPEELSQNETIVETGTEVGEAIRDVPLIGKIVNTTTGLIDRLTNGTMRATSAIQNVNITALTNSLESAVGAGIELVNVTLETGREVLAPVENTTRRALGDAFDDFISGIRQEFEAFFSEQNIQNLFYSIIEIPQSIIMSIQSMLYEFAGIGAPPAMPATSYDPRLEAWNVDAITGAY